MDVRLEGIRGQTSKLEFLTEFDYNDDQHCSIAHRARSITSFAEGVGIGARLPRSAAQDNMSTCYIVFTFRAEK